MEDDILKRMKIVEEVMRKVSQYPEHLQKETYNFIMSGISKNTGINSDTGRKKKKIKGKGRSRSGIVTQLNKLINDKFFDSPRSMKEVLDKLSILGFNIKHEYLSPKLLYFVRTRKLSRHKDKEKRYVYYTQKLQKSGEDSE